MTAHALHWDAQALWRELEPWLPGLSVEVVAHTTSTNTALLERGRIRRAELDHDGAVRPHAGIEAVAFGRRAADVQPCLLVAEHQTGGRGRHGRTWQSAPGASLTFSLSMPIAAADWSGLSLAIGVALAEALDPPLATASGVPRLGIKWPNDLWLLDPAVATPDDASAEPAPVGRKLAGILVETVMAGPHRLAVVGIGINILPLAPQAMSETSTGYACLQEIEPQASAPATLARIALPVVRSLRRFEREGFAGFRAAFHTRDLLAGRRVYTSATGLPEGVARGVSESGALLLQTDDGLHTVASGEVSVRLTPLPASTDSPAPC